MLHIPMYSLAATLNISLVGGKEGEKRWRGKAPRFSTLSRADVDEEEEEPVGWATWLGRWLEECPCWVEPCL